MSACLLACVRAHVCVCVCVCVCRPTLSRSCCHPDLSSMIHTVNTQTHINVDLHHSHTQHTHTFSMSVLVFDILECLQFIVWILQLVFEQLDS